MIQRRSHLVEGELTPSLVTSTPLIFSNTWSRKVSFLLVYISEFQIQRVQVQQRMRKKCQILCEPMQSQFLSSRQLRRERRRKKSRGNFFRISNRGRNGSNQTIREDFRIRITLSTTM